MRAQFRFGQATRIYQHLLKELASLEHNFIDIGLHAKGISEYLVALQIDSCDNLSQWFHIANGIKHLEYDGITYDDSFAMCRPAYEYEVARQELYQRLVREITFFSYVYSGLEGIITFIDPTPCQQSRGKIFAATHYLKAALSKWSIPVASYDQILLTCEQMYRLTFDQTYSITSERTDCVSVHGLGLRLVYKIRNRIMHGDLFFPEPLDYSAVLPFHPEIVRLCSRITLLSVQMLLLACRKGNYDPYLEIYNASLAPSDEEGQTFVHEKAYLSNLHVKQAHFCHEQLELPFA